MKTLKLNLRPLLTMVLVLIVITVNAQTSTLVELGPDGKLVYTPDANGNIIPDFSAVGYMNGEEPIPNIPVEITLSPVAGDNLSQIQAAIDQLEATSADANGYRGTILLTQGEYNVSNTLYIEESGIVLRGEGNGTSDTRLIATRTAKHDLIRIQGGGISTSSSTTKQIQGSYIPIGAKTFTVESGHTFTVGDRVLLERKPKQAWLSMLGTDNLSQSDPGDSDWTTGAYEMEYKRNVVAVNGNDITLDAPVVDPIDQQYADGFLTKYTWSSRVEKCGVENIRIESEYQSDTDENHGWNAIVFNNSEHCWVTDVVTYYFGYSLVSVNGSASNVSILDCQCMDPKSQTAGGRKYSFNIGGQRNLIKDCHAYKGRHDYVNGARVCGPNAFVYCTAADQKSDIGPHHRWATGSLFDNVVGNGEQNAQNRKNSGSGHGWAGAQTMFWNCTASRFKVQSPPNHVNWAIGCTGTHTSNGNYHNGDPGHWESQGTPIAAIPSLYEQQLCERLGLEGCGGSSCSPASASTHDGNVPENVLDNDLQTRWSAQGDGQWIKFCFGENDIPLSGVQIAFYLGAARSSNFDVEYSSDGETWTSVLTNQNSSGSSVEYEAFDFPQHIWASQLRITGHGNSLNTWNSFTKVRWDTARVPYQSLHLIPGFIECEEYDLGGEGIAYSDATPGNEGNAFRSDDVDLQELTPGNYNIGWTDPGEWVNYSVDVQGDGMYDFALRSSASTTAGLLTLLIDGIEVGQMVPPITGDWQTYQTVELLDISLTAGEHLLTLRVDADGFNMDQLEVSPSVVSGDSPGPFSDESYSLFPNPISAGNKVQIQTQSTSPYKIFDHQGKLVGSGELNKIDTSRLTSGNYSIVTSGQHIQKLVVL